MPPRVNHLGLKRTEYRGRPSTLCPGCGHDSISNQIVTMAYELGLEQHKIVKISGIGCSSKTPAYFLGGSHKKTTYDNVGITENMADIFRVYPDFVNLPSMAAPMKAGSCSFHNALLVHGAGANMTGGWRRAMTCGFMPYGSTFNGNQNILSDEQFASYELGDVLDDDRQNPVVWHHNPELITAKP